MMDNFISFLRYHRNELIGYFVFIIIFYVVFLFGNLDLSYFVLGVQSTAFVFVIYLVIAEVRFRKRLSLQDEYNHLTQQMQELRSQMINQRDDLQTYFLLWLHQIKTPMTVSKLLLDKADSEVGKKLQVQMLYIDQYINMAMSYLKIFEYSSDMDITYVDLDEVITGLLKKYAMLFIHKHISLDYHKIESKVISDGQWLSILIEQILSNALKYMNEGKISIFYDEDSHTLSISDTGIGIRSEDIPRIFDRGYSGFNGRLNEKSSGLGLYLAKRVADKLQIRIEVDSVVNQGSTFHLVLPSNLTEM